MSTRSLTIMLIATNLAMTPAVLAQSPGAEPVTGAQTPSHSQPAAEKPRSNADEKLDFQGDTALWTVAIRPDKTADFERVLAKLRQALTSSKDPLRRRQAAGWKVVRLTTPLPDGNVGYLHLINPAVPEADYSVMRTLYDELPDERQALYELYRGAFAGNIALAVGNVVVDLDEATPPSGSATPSSPTSPTASAILPAPSSSAPGPPASPVSPR